jgi:4a-hydroxytetrahydrobiopterin dehydratase
MATLLSQANIQTALKTLPGWKYQKKSLIRLYVFPDFTSALLFANHVGYLAEKADHHPDIDISYKNLKLTLSTHSAGGLTRKDVSLARQIDRVRL